MSTSSESSDEDVIVIYTYLRRRRKKRFWVHPYIERNYGSRLFIAVRELSEDDGKFKAMYRMSKTTFLELVRLVKPLISRQNTNMRECVGAEERIMITLRYLASGCSFVSLGLYFARGDNTISSIIADTTVALWKALQPAYMALPNSETWKAISRRFSDVWNLPNCLGAIDGKHIRIQKLPNSGSSNYNYKQYNSIVLMAICDADGLFTIIETGFAGRNNDGGIFSSSRIGYWLERDGISIPRSSQLPHDETQQQVPYFFVGDNAFPLKRYLLRPYPTGSIDNKKRIFNFRLSRARKTIECSFGMMASKFQVLQTPIRCINYDTVVNITKSVCVLHNFVRIKDGIPYSASIENIPNTPQQIFNLQEEPMQINERSSGPVVRKYLANYFLKPLASLPYQYNYCV